MMLNNLQVLRGLAALMVVLDHWGDLHGGALRRLGLLGATGVDIFFVLSGFVMTYTAARKPVTPSAFIVNRFVRIVPLYWSLTIVWVLGALAVPRFFPSTHVNATDLAKSLLFIPYLNAQGTVRPIIVPGWTLNFEMFFYALFALSLLLPTTRLQRGAVLAVVAGLVLVGAVYRPTGVLARFYTSSIMLEFGYGMVLALLFQHRPQHLSSRGWALPLLIVGAVALLAAQVALPDTARGVVLGLPAMLVLFAALSLEVTGAVIRFKPLLLLGAASYAIYLVHVGAMVVLMRPVNSLGLEHGLLFPATALAVVGGATSIGIAVHLLYERPFDRLLRRLLRGRADRQGDAAALWPWRRG